MPEGSAPGQVLGVQTPRGTRAAESSVVGCGPLKKTVMAFYLRGVWTVSSPS